MDLFPISSPEVSKRENGDDRLDAATEATNVNVVPDISKSSVFRGVLVDDDPDAPSPHDMPKFKRPGSRYKRHRKVEELDAPVAAFLEAAAECIGARLETIVHAVFQCELKLERLRKDQRRNGEGRPPTRP